MEDRRERGQPGSMNPGREGAGQHGWKEGTGSKGLWGQEKASDGARNKGRESVIWEHCSGRSRAWKIHPRSGPCSAAGALGVQGKAGPEVWVGWKLVSWVPFPLGYVALFPDFS